jgi:branched-chain amino acid transport system permease protein
MIGIVAIAYSLPSFLSNQFLVFMLILICLWGLLAEAWNIIGGFAGQLSLGHAAYFGIGAYTSTLLFINYGISPWVGMIAGGFLAMVSSVLVGYPCFKLREVYYSLVTVSFAEILRLVFISQVATPWTSGARGLVIQIRDNPLLFQFSSYNSYYYVILSMMLIATFIAKKIMNSKFGLHLFAIRDDEYAAKSIGIDVRNSKLKAGAVSAFLTGIAGTFYAQFFGYIDPNATMAYVISLQMILFALIGGKGSVMGPILGAIVMVPIDAYASMTLGGSYQGLHLMIYAAVMIAIVAFKPEGLIVIVEMPRKSIQSLLRRIS